MDIFLTVKLKENCALEELIMSKDKYLSIFLKPSANYLVYYPLNIFRNAHLGNIQSRDVLRPITCELKFLMDYSDG